MAREFILFVHICHWIGGKTAVPFKTYPSWLTTCHRGKMKASSEWGQAQTPTRLNKSSSVLFLFFFPGIQTFCAFCVSPSRQIPKYGTHFSLSLSISMRPFNYSRQICLQHRRETRKPEKNFGEHKAFVLLPVVMGLVRTLKA
jgi:hypothetical protein